jgi:hypothetical protein
MYNLELANPMAQQRAFRFSSYTLNPRWLFIKSNLKLFTFFLNISLHAANTDVKLSDYIHGPRTLQIRLSHWLPALLAG